MKTNNEIRLKQRLLAIIIDYLIIIAYLLSLFIIFTIMYLFILDGVPEYSAFESQLIATFTTVIPIILLFTCLESTGKSFGKNKTGLKLHFTKSKTTSALIRNSIKFLPWQLGHMGTIQSIYNDFNLWSVMLSWVSILLLITLLFMAFFRSDKRHLGNILAGTQVQSK